MELVFVHGWGFDASFWDALAALLPEYPQRRIERGYFGKPGGELKLGQPAILIGHSLGFVFGLKQRQNWASWIAINSFARFTAAPEKIGCVSPVVLCEMRGRLASDPAQTLKDFYALIGAHTYQTATPDVERLCVGLDELRDEDVGDIISKLDVPGLVLASRNDPLVPVKTSEALTKEARHVRLEWHETNGHLLPQSDPAWCARAIREFLSCFSKT